jgi:hypothetical protein
MLRGAFVTGLLLLTGCSGSWVGATAPGNADTASTTPTWECSLSGSDKSACGCTKVMPEPGSVHGFSNAVDSCQAYSCCLLTKQSATTRCDCTDGVTSCEAEAATRPGASVVAQCPPASEVPASTSACARTGENCRFDYLAQSHLHGCCAGSICLANADHTPVCQKASAEDVKLAQTCAKVARARVPLDSSTPPVRVTTPSIRTSVGEFHFDKLQFGFIGVGSGGCLNSMDLTFIGSKSSCSLELQADLHNGQLSPSSVLGFFNNCEGYTGSAFFSGTIVESKPAAIPFELTFTGLACDGEVSFESYCVAGTYDWHLRGTIGGVSFDDQHLILDGVLCSAEPKGDCPSP